MTIMTLTENRRPGRPCALCSHPDQASILDAVLSGRSYRVVAREYGGTSADGIRRHLRHTSPEIRERVFDGVGALSVAQRTVEIADSARDLRIAAEEAGTPAALIQASYLELSALRVLADRLNLTDRAVIEEIDDGKVLVQTIIRLAREDDTLRARFIEALDAEGREDLADLARPKCNTERKARRA